MKLLHIQHTRFALEGAAATPRDLCASAAGLARYIELVGRSLHERCAAAVTSMAPMTGSASPVRRTALLWRRTLEETRPDVVHLHLLEPQIDARLVRELAHVARVVVTWHDSSVALYHPDGIASTAGGAIPEWLLPSARNAPKPGALLWPLRCRGARLLVPGGLCREQALISGWDPRSVIVSSYGIPSLPARPVHPPRTTGPVRFTLIATPAENDVASEFVRAIALQREGDWQAEIIGLAPPASIVALIAEQGLPARIRVAATVPGESLRGLYATSDVVLLTALVAEQASLVGIEALFLGLPVVVLAPGCAPAWLRHEENGLVLDPRDQPPFAHGLGRLLRDPSFRKRLGTAARHHAQAHCTVAAHVEALQRVYLDACAASADAKALPRAAPRLLLVTPLDYAAQSNNREHNMVRHFAAMGSRITLACPKLNHSSRLIDMLRDTLTLRVRSAELPGTRLVEVDPFFNYHAGFRVSCEEATRSPARKGWLRLLVVRALSPLAVLRDLSLVPCLLGAILRRAPGRFDAVVGFGPWGALVGWLACKLGKASRLVYQDRDYEPGLVPDRLRRIYTGWLEKKLLRRADLIVSIGPRLAELRRAQAQKAVHVIPTGVDWDLLARARLRPHRGHTLVYAGALFSWSGLEVAIPALQRIRRLFPEARLLVIGGGQPAYETLLREMAAAHGLDGSIEFCGRQPHSRVAELLARGDLGLAVSQPVPFRQYAYPLKVIEYMAAGLPVLATEGTEAADIVERCGCGLPVRYDAARLAEAVCELFADAARYDRCRAQGLRHAASMDWRSLLARELDLILGGPTSPPTHEFLRSGEGRRGES
ncbi:MAG: glycosyltransferase [Planctomycetota bacterium]